MNEEVSFLSVIRDMLGAIAFVIGFTGVSIFLAAIIVGLFR